MSEPEETGPGGVLASLPSTRPQRRSPKRDRSQALPGPKTAGADRAPRAPAASSPGPARATQAGARTEASDAGRGAESSGAAARPGERGRRAAQGYESSPLSGPVEPPSRSQLLGSVAGGTGDLLHAGLDLTRQALRSVLGRLPGL